jgi:hypothetical protein
MVFIIIVEESHFLHNIIDPITSTHQIRLLGSFHRTMLRRIASSTRMARRLVPASSDMMLRSAAPRMLVTLSGISENVGSTTSVSGGTVGLGASSIWMNISPLYQQYYHHRRWTSSGVDIVATAAANDDTLTSGDDDDNDEDSADKSDSTSVVKPKKRKLKRGRPRNMAPIPDDSEKKDSETTKSEKEPPAGKVKLTRKREPIRVLTKSQARGLFDEIAPHLPLTLVRNMCGFFKKKKSLASKEGSFASKVDNLWEHEPDKTKIPPTWVRDTLRRVLLYGQGQRKSSKQYKKVFSDPKDVRAFAPIVNRQHWETNLESLMQIREAWVQNQPGDGAKRTFSDDETQQLSLTYATREQGRALHLTKSEMELKKEAETLLSHLADKLPGDDFRQCMEHLHSIQKHISDTNEISPFMANTLFWKSTRTHIHLVISEMSAFFYVDLASSGVHTKASKAQLQGATKQWDKLRQRFALTLPAFHQIVVEGKKLTKKQQEEDAIGEVDLQLHKQENVKPVAAAAVTEPDTRSRAQIGLQVKKNMKKGPKIRKYHVNLDAMLLTDNTPRVPHADRMVFLDNLPIDITEMELFDLYSRCGPIQSIAIHNQRPDLDPGALSMKQIKDRKRRLRTNRRVIINRSAWARPKTPLYALVTFATDEGFNVACGPPLRLFGMVVRKHAIRSIRAMDMNKLYIEYLPPGIHSADLEYQLAKLLRDRNIYVCLDLGQHTRREPTSCEITFPSFEVAYSSYDTVLKSIGVFEETEGEWEEDDISEEVEPEDETDEAEKDETSKEVDSEDDETDKTRRMAVSWLQTPHDAVAYWTREVGFEN